MGNARRSRPIRSSRRTERPLASALGPSSLLKRKGAILDARPPDLRQTRLMGVVTAGSPHIDAGEQEQPHHVDEVPVPGGSLEAEMLLRREVAAHRPDQAYRQEDGADNDVEAMEARGHEEGRAVDVVGEAEAGMHVLIGLGGGEQDAQYDGASEPKHETSAIVVEQRMMRPGHRRARGEQDQRVDEGQAPRIEGMLEAAEARDIGLGARG